MQISGISPKEMSQVYKTWLIASILQNCLNSKRGGGKNPEDPKNPKAQELGYLNKLLLYFTIKPLKCVGKECLVPKEIVMTILKVQRAVYKIYKN